MENICPIVDLISLEHTVVISGASAFVGTTGFGQDRRFHSAHMFDLVDHPVQITMVVTEEECDRLFALLTKEKLDLFVRLLPVEFGKVGRYGCCGPTNTEREAMNRKIARTPAA